MEQDLDGGYSRWRLVDASIATRIDGGDPNSNAHVAFVHDRGEPGGLRLQIAWAKLINRGGSTVIMGYGVRLPRSLWRAGQWTHATTTYTDDTTDAQSPAAADVPLETTTNGDGILVACATTFSAISFNIATASAGTTPARVVEYSRAGGTWGTLVTQISMFPATGAHFTTGENVCWFVAPSDWRRMVAGHGTNVPVGLFGIRIRAVTAPTTTAAVASTLSVHDIHLAAPTTAANGESNLLYGGVPVTLNPEGEALVMATTAPTANNSIQALIRTRG